MAVLVSIKQTTRVTLDQCCVKVSITMFSKKLFHFLVILFICVALKKNNRRLKQKIKENRSDRQVQQNFHEVDAFGDDFIDFGAQTGPHGQFSWHADFPLERRWTTQTFTLNHQVCPSISEKQLFKCCFYLSERDSKHPANRFVCRERIRFGKVARTVGK